MGNALEETFSRSVPCDCYRRECTPSVFFAETARAVATECYSEQVAAVIAVIETTVVGNECVALVIGLTAVRDIACFVECIVGGIIVTPILIIVTGGYVDRRFDCIKSLVVVGVGSEQAVSVLLRTLSVGISTRGVVVKTVLRHPHSTLSV